MPFSPNYKNNTCGLQEKIIENTDKQKENISLPDPTSQAMWIANQKVCMSIQDVKLMHISL